MFYRIVPFPLIGLILSATAVSAQATAPAAINACYVPLTGTVYRIMESRLPSSCVSDDHVQFSWTDDEDAIRVSDAAGGDLSGDFTDPTVAGLRGRPLASTPPEDGEILTWDAAAGEWVPEAPAPTSGWTSPNGRYGMAMTDDGIVLTGPTTEIRMDADGLLLTSLNTEIRMHATGLVLTDSNSRIEVGGGVINLASATFLHISDVAGNEIVTGPTGMQIRGAARLDLLGAGVIDLTGGILRLNGCSGPVAVEGRSVVTTTGHGGAFPVMNGVPTVCAGS